MEFASCHPSGTSDFVLACGRSLEICASLHLSVFVYI
jgi:hypothetical protein